MPNLFPVNYRNNMPIIGILTAKKQIGYKPSIFFDDNSGDILCDGQKRLITASGVDAWRQWCINCLETERGVYPSYSTDFGICTKKVFLSGDKATAEAILENEIIAALMADDYKRTRSVSDFVFDWIAPDAVTVSMSITGITGAQIDISVKVGGING